MSPGVVRRDQRQRSWLSAHLYFDGPVYSSAGDDVIRRVVTPVLDSLGEHRAARAFFIRYVDDGPHVRLRISAPSAYLVSTVGPAIEDIATRQSLRLKWIPYEPEIARYGGPWAVPVAEELFCVSSRLVCTLLSTASPCSQSARLGFALVSQLILMRTFIDDRRAAASIATGYSQTLLRERIAHVARRTRHVDADMDATWDHQRHSLERMTNEIWRSAPAALPRPFAIYQRRLRRLRQDLNTLVDDGRVILAGRTAQNREGATQFLIASYLHMSNNRFGLSLLDEAYISRLVGRVLQEAITLPSTAS